MNKHLYVSVTALAMSFAASMAAAQQPSSPFYIVPKIAAMDADFSGFDKAFNVGAGVGYDLQSNATGTLSVEGEFLTTLSDGDIGGGGEWDADTIAVYGAYRTAGNGYLKAKAGFLDQDIKVEAGVARTPITGDESGFSFGIGAGWRMNGNAGLELEYTAGSDDLNIISLGYITRF